MGKSKHHHHHHNHKDHRYVEVNSSEEEEVKSSDFTGSTVFKLGALVFIAIIAVVVVVSVNVNGNEDETPSVAQVSRADGFVQFEYNEDDSEDFSDEDDDSDDFPDDDDDEVATPTKNPTPHPTVPPASNDPAPADPVATALGAWSKGEKAGDFILEEIYNNPPNNLKGDPRIPYDKVATVGHDPYALMGRDFTWSKEGVSFDFRPQALDIREADTRLAGDVAHGKSIPGRVVKDGEPLVEYYPGNLPVILFCVHTTDGKLRPWIKNWPLATRACRSGKCKTHQAMKNLQAIPDADFKKLRESDIVRRMQKNTGKVEMELPVGDGSGPFCRETFEYIGKKTGNYPHMIYQRVPKMFLDFNRHPAKTWLQVQGDLGGSKGLKYLNPEAYATYHDGLNFLREAKNVIARQFGYGWLFNHHSMGGAKRIGVGMGYNKPGNTKQVYNDPQCLRSQVMNKNKQPQLFAYDYEARGMNAHETTLGRFSPGEILQTRGVGGAPSRSWMYIHKSKEPKCYCGSTAIESNFGPLSLDVAEKKYDDLPVKNRPFESWYVGRWNTAIVETYGKYLNGNMHDDLVEMWGETIIDICDDLWGLKIRRKNYQRPYPDLNTQFESTTPAATCAGKAIEARKAKRHAFFSKECVDACRNEIAGCKHVVMKVEPKATNYCYFYKTCDQKVAKRFWHIIDVDRYVSGL